MTNKLLRIEDLYVEYETDDATMHAVNGLDLEIEEGETLGLVGETGAGKTTAALSVMKLLPEKIGTIKKGRIELDNLDIINAAEADMRSIRGNIVSMIFQDPMTSLNPILTVGDQIYEVLKLHRKDSSNAQLSKRVDEILQLVGIPSDRKNNYPHQFSGGMKQRVVIAIALACEPKLLLADEPTTALDVTIQAQVLEMMKTLKEKLKTSMILITHDMGVVAQTCDRVAIMYAGEVIEIGKVEDIFENKNHHPYTEGLFGSIPDLTKSTRRLSPIQGLMPDPTDLPKGCAFNPRCPKCMDKCKIEKPANAVNGSHTIKCHLFK
ncbi:ABC transporter ATP-binding protein [Alkaliphilus peptidifermentans]|uniref:Peptide/nickel transport system ATP-binding protein n=1 Tax=Alkaliphilus peptidifermentans DSM 18978 TaxID=1120976 RepID=A0A1G5E417_9FIRM|nr:ABC transporter ATP-binding protein [Alkaliphilus peptidifermentans]SCY21615.1 peptide/nickel transport system ATP-binding protein [Alkaliphilus peptidifermentans DSM 18978]